MYVFLQQYCVINERVIPAFAGMTVNQNFFRILLGKIFVNMIFGNNLQNNGFILFQ